MWIIWLVTSLIADASTAGLEKGSCVARTTTSDFYFSTSKSYSQWCDIEITAELLREQISEIRDVELKEAELNSLTGNAEIFQGGNQGVAEFPR